MPWDLTGNAGTNPGTDFVGTSDGRPLVIKTDSAEAVRIDREGHVGVGTPNPQNLMHIGPGTTAITSSRINLVIASAAPDAGIAISQQGGVDVLLQASGAGAFLGTTTNHAMVFRTADQDRVVVNEHGNVGVGTAPWLGKLDVVAAQHGITCKSESGEAVHAETRSDRFAAIAAYATSPSSRISAVYAEHQGAGAGVFASATNGPAVMGVSARGEGVHGETSSTKFPAVGGIAKGVDRDSNGTAAIYGEHQGTGPAIWGVSVTGEGVHGETQSEKMAGIAGINTSATGTGAGVYGKSTHGPAGFFAGDVVVTGDVLLVGADCAEDFEIADSERLEPGTVMVIDNEGRLTSSRLPYDTKVAGVISGAGAFKPAIVLDRQSDRQDRQPIALVGKVYCKVDAGVSPIAVGDLLTTSSTPGHAMKAVSAGEAFGAVLGKALRPLASGCGLIPILVTLQ